MFQMLERFLIQTGRGELLEFAGKSQLLPKERRKIVNAIVDFMIKTFDPVSKTVKRLTAKATIALFPALEFKNSTSDGTVNLKFVVYCN